MDGEIARTTNLIFFHIRQRYYSGSGLWQPNLAVDALASGGGGFTGLFGGGGFSSGGGGVNFGAGRVSRQKVLVDLVALDWIRWSGAPLASGGLSSSVVSRLVL